MPAHRESLATFGLAPADTRRRLSVVAHTGLIFVVYLVLALAGIYLSRQPGTIAVLWFANALAVAALAGGVVRRWPAILAAVGLAGFAANLVAGDDLGVAAAFATANLTEVAIGGTLLRRFCRPLQHALRPDGLVRALLLGAAVPIMIGASLGAGLLHAADGRFRDVWLLWVLGGGIGSVSLLPIGLLIAAKGWRFATRPLLRPEVVAAILVALAVTLWAIATVPFPFVYISASLVLVAWVSGVAGTAIGNLACTIGVGCLIAWGVFQPPPLVGSFGTILFYLPLMLSVVAPLLLAASLDTMRHQVESFAAERNLMETTLNAISEGVVTTDSEGRIAYLNPVAETFIGLQAEDAKGRRLASTVDLREPGSGALLPDVVQPCLSGQCLPQPIRFAILRRPDGGDRAVQLSVAPICQDNFGLLGTVVVLRDETEARLLAERTAYLAHHDALTGLPNRVLFQDRLLHACQTAERNQGHFSVMFLDLDHFKHVNDSLGHATGDELLKVMAKRLTALLRQSDTVCRLGGDEFVVLLGAVSRGDDAGEVARKILREVARPCVIGESEFSISATVGISVFPDDGRDADTLMKHADAAMYRAKREGRNRFQFFSHTVDEVAVARLKIEGEMRQGLLNGQFKVYYQPIVDGMGGRAIGVEALARWMVGGRDVYTPDAFIPVAEETRMILPLGVFVLRQACMQLRSWEGSALNHLTIAVNISTVQLSDPAFVDAVTEILRSTGVAGNRLVFEVTESALTEDPDGVAGVLVRLRRLGIRIAIDDFGTGYANLSYLKRFPVDCIKIDRSFVRDLDHDYADRELVKVIVTMARNLGLKVVAEGVETVAQAVILNDLQCSVMQGYLFARPADSATTRRWLTSYVGADQPAASGTAMLQA